MSDKTLKYFDSTVPRTGELLKTSCKGCQDLKVIYHNDSYVVSKKEENIALHMSDGCSPTPCAQLKNALPQKLQTW